MSVTTVEAPPRNLYDVGPWLCERLAGLMKLCHEIGAVRNGLVDVGNVRDSVISYDEFKRARSDHNRRNGLPERGDIASVSITLGPQPTLAGGRMLLMTPGDIARLRLLATTAPALYGWPNVEWCVDDLALLNGDPMVSLFVAALGQHAATS